MTSSEAEALTAARLVELICPILAGHPPEVQSAVLADLLAMWIAGHFTPRTNEDEWVNDQLLAEMRDDLLVEHVKLVRDLVKPNQEMILEQMRRGSS